MDTAELLKKVRRIEIKTKGLSNHLFAGEYQTAFKGRGMSFAEVREYQYGDDIRAIDWNVTARLNQPYVKVFEEERELTVMLLIDVSQSDYFGTRSQLKIELMTEIAAVLSFSAINNDDKVGVLFFSDRIEKYIPPKKGKKHILRIIRELLDFKPEGKQTDISGTLRFFTNMMKKRSIAFLISDFLDPQFDKALQISSRKHDLIGIHILDRQEGKLPNLGLVRFVDPETGQKKWINTTDNKVQLAYKQWYDAQNSYTNQSFLKSKADLINIKTGENYTQALINFFKSRDKR